MFEAAIAEPNERRNQRSGNRAQILDKAPLQLHLHSEKVSGLRLAQCFCEVSKHRFVDGMYPAPNAGIADHIEHHLSRAANILIDVVERGRGDLTHFWLESLHSN